MIVTLQLALMKLTIINLLSEGFRLYSYSAMHDYVNAVLPLCTSHEYCVIVFLPHCSPKENTCFAPSIPQVFYVRVVTVAMIPDVVTVSLIIIDRVIETKFSIKDCTLDKASAATLR